MTASSGTIISCIVERVQSWGWAKTVPRLASVRQIFSITTVSGVPTFVTVFTGAWRNRGIGTW